jgi:predicted ArsR family transcriptional regulator
MIHIMGERQQKLLQLLLRTKTGMTIEGLAAGLNITKTAVRQHLAVLERDRLVIKSQTRPSGGRPEHLYVLADAGSALFPRHYAMFAELLLDIVEEQAGETQVGDLLAAAGKKVARKLRAERLQGNETLPQRVEKLAGLMEDLGYAISAQGTDTSSLIPVIEADNCVFHDLAKANTHVCRFDLALLSDFTASNVTHTECMVRGGESCRFSFAEKVEAI